MEKRGRGVSALNSNLILLIQNEQVKAIQAEIDFKFQSDSINTDIKGSCREKPGLYFKFQSDSINTICLINFFTKITTLNSNLILLILSHIQTRISKKVYFKFQSDSINTKQSFAMTLKKYSLNSNLILLILLRIVQYQLLKIL